MYSFFEQAKLWRTRNSIPLTIFPVLSTKPFNENLNMSERSKSGGQNGAENAVRFVACKKRPDDARPNKKNDYRLLAETKPSVPLEGSVPRLIDGWQEAPQLWDAVRFYVDQENEPGLFLLAGSSTPTAMPSHSGAGRIVSIDMAPMSLAESKESTAEVSLANLFDGQLDYSGYSECDIEDMAYPICRGGWPRAVTSKSKEASLEMALDYLSTIAEQDISRADRITLNPQYARLIMREYARVSASQATQSTILKDLKARDIDLPRNTVNGYLAALRRLYVIHDLSAWTPSLRAKSRITKTPTRHFVCPSIAAAALGASPKTLLMDTVTMGLYSKPYAYAICAHTRRSLTERYFIITTKPAAKPMPSCSCVTDAMRFSK